MVSLSVGTPGVKTTVEVDGSILKVLESPDPNQANRSVIDASEVAAEKLCLRTTARFARVTPRNGTFYIELDTNVSIVGFSVDVKEHGPDYSFIDARNRTWVRHKGEPLDAEQKRIVGRVEWLPGGYFFLFEETKDLDAQSKREWQLLHNDDR